MPWEDINLETHQCQKPDNEAVLKVQGIGSIWICEYCHGRWRLLQIEDTKDNTPSRPQTLWEPAGNASHARYR